MTTHTQLRPLPGRATPEGTARFRDRFATLAPDFFREALGLHISSIGLGTYLGNADAETDRAYGETLRLAPTLGCNLIDTAINYRCQFSERVIGDALRALVAEGTVQRDEMVVCSKGGYLSFDGTPADPRAWILQTFIDPGIIGWPDIVAHNVMHPDYIRHEVEASLSNLGVETIDVYYLHNPEAQLQGLSSEQLTVRLAACFEALEKAVADGRIGVYGIASWDAFRAEPGTAAALSMSALVHAAREVAGDGHHFRVIQLPFSLGMSEAFSRPTQSLDEGPMPALESAFRLGLSVFASASLLQGRLTRLPPEFGKMLPGLTSDAQRSLQFTRSAPGIVSALVGMKTTAHVRENLALASRPMLSQDAFIDLFS